MANGHQVNTTYYKDSDNVPLLYPVADAKQNDNPLNATLFHRPAFAHVDVELGAGQRVVGDAGVMLWMDGDVQMSTSCHNGCLTAYCRTCAFESFCMNTYNGPGKVAFGFDLPGDMLPFGVEAGQRGWILTTGSFICGSENVKVSAQFAGLSVCLCGGEGMFLTHVTSESGTGVFYAGGYGAIQRHEIAQGSTFYVDTGLFFACQDDASIEIALPGTCTTCLCGGEGFVMKFFGPLVLYTQNRDPGVINGILNPPGAALKDLAEAAGDSAMSAGS